MAGSKREPRAEAAVKREMMIKKEVAGLRHIKADAHLKSETCKLALFKTKLEQQHHARLKSELKQETKKEFKTDIPKLKAETRVSDLLNRGLKLQAMAEKHKKRVKHEAKLKGIKREKKGIGKKRRNSTGKRKRGSAARRNASREVMNRAVSLSPELATLVGAPALSRPEVVRRLWANFRDRGLLNPVDKREVLFDDELREIFGTASTRMFEIQSLLTPHLDYTTTPAEIATGPASSIKKHEKIKQFKSDAMPAIKKQVKELLSDSTQKHIHVHGAKAEALLAKTKHEQAAVATHVTKPNVTCHDVEGSTEITKDEQMAINCTKAELAPKNEPPGKPIKVTNVKVSSLIPRISELKRTSARVEITLPASYPTLEVVAVPISTVDGTTLQNSSNELATVRNAVRATCFVEFEEMADGNVEPYAKGQLLNLQPDLTYRVSVRLQEFGEDKKTMSSCNSVEVRLPQRACPAKWTSHEALLWCGFLRVPEFAAKVKEYGIDGTTLLTLGDEDLCALGISAPFLRRRIIAALEELRTA